MAVFGKIHAVTDRLDKRIDYAITADKTLPLLDKIEYAVNDEKTEHAMYAGVINCNSVETAFDEMMQTKAKFRKEEGVLAYTFIQSFSPDDNVTPELAHDIGMKLAKEYFGDRYQVVVGTHIDKAHLHNHFVVNSVSFVDGKKYRNKLHYLDELRELNDRLCRENALSVILTDKISGTESYTDWKDRKNGIQPRGDLIRADIDDCVRQSITFNHFIKHMKKLGYSVRYGPNVKYMTVTAPGAERARRIYKLGDAYTEEAIRQRIDENTPEQVNEAIRKTKEREETVPGASAPILPALIRVRHTGTHMPRKKLKGLQARYFRILYTFGMIRKHPRQAGNRAMYNMLYDQVRQLDGYIRQMNLLKNQNITTADELNEYKSRIEQQIRNLTRQRGGLYRRQQNGEDCKASIAELTAQLKPLRQTMRDCTAIQKRSEETLRRIREAEEKQKEEKERKRASQGRQSQQR